MARQYQRSSDTRQLLIAAATDHFAEAGFDGTSLDAVARRSGVSKGAIYHHFISKVALLEAVFDQMSMQCVEYARSAAAQETDPARRIAAALRHWLIAVLQPAARRILLNIGPVGIGLVRARAIEMKNSHMLMRIAVERAILAARPVPEGTASDKTENVFKIDKINNADLIAGVLNSLVVELALDVCARGDNAAANDTHFAMIDRLVTALVTDEAA